MVIMLVAFVGGRGQPRQSVGLYNRMSEAQRKQSFDNYQDLVKKTEDAQQKHKQAKAEHERLDKELAGFLCEHERDGAR